MTSPSGPNGATPAAFSIQVDKRDRILAVTISGEFDLAASQEFGQVAAELARDGIREVEIDLRQVSFIDSSGLRMLVETERAAKARELELRIIRGGAAVDRVIQITGLGDVLPLVDG